MKVCTGSGNCLVVAAFSAMVLFMATGCGDDESLDDTDGGRDSIAVDSVDFTDVATDVKVCVDSECRCPRTQKDCGGICTTLGTSENCSDCGDECPTGGSCESGTCRCPFGQVDCYGVCSTLGMDDNCSACGDACIGTKTCQNKRCVAEVDPECLPTVPCVTDDDCVSGSRCNQAIFPPACQKLYCGGFDTVCSEDYFCLSQICNDETCTNDCSELECGPDPIYGESCGTCQEGATCISNHCVCGPQDHLECVAGNSTWIDSCGNVGSVKDGCPLACLNGACVDCEAVGKVSCSGTCTLLGTVLNCSGCGHACPAGGSCESGTCKCPVGQADCSGICTSLGTTTNCSICGDECTGGKSCQHGICNCPVGQADCFGTCKSLGTNTDCSGCGDVCLTGGLCKDGSCKCPVGEADCDGLCKLLGTVTDCSECGDNCGGGKTCQEGGCRCPALQVDCLGTCRSLGTNLNCSECGDVCNNNKTCQGGTCQCPALLTDCSGTCKPLGTDSDCSECGDTCSSNMICKDGACSCEGIDVSIEGSFTSRQKFTLTNVFPACTPGALTGCDTNVASMNTGAQACCYLNGIEALFKDDGTLFANAVADSAGYDSTVRAALVSKMKDRVSSSSPAWVTKAATMGTTLRYMVLQTNLTSIINVHAPDSEGIFDGNEDWRTFLLFWKLDCDPSDPAYYACGKLELSMTSLGGISYTPVVSKSTFDGSLGSGNNFSIDTHNVGLNPGRLLVYSVNKVAAATLTGGYINASNELITVGAAADLKAAYGRWFDCTAVADDLFGQVAGISDKEGLRTACLAAIDLAMANVTAAHNALVVDSHLELSGTGAYIETSCTGFANELNSGVYQGNYVRGSETTAVSGTFSGVN